MDSTQTRTDRRLGRAALIVTAFVILAVSTTAWIATSRRGEIEIPAEWRSQSDYTLIVFGRESCPACAASAAFHKELAAAAEAHGVRTVAASTSATENPAAFAASIGLKPDRALRAIPAPKHLLSVPAILVVNRDGAILRETQGALSAEQKRALVSFVAGLR